LSKYFEAFSPKTSVSFMGKSPLLKMETSALPNLCFS
jgi:hypothetical protein